MGSRFPAPSPTSSSSSPRSTPGQWMDAASILKVASGEAKLALRASSLVLLLLLLRLVLLLFLWRFWFSLDSSKGVLDLQVVFPRSCIKARKACSLRPFIPIRPFSSDLDGAAVKRRARGPVMAAKKAAEGIWLPYELFCMWFLFLESNVSEFWRSICCWEVDYVYFLVLLLLSMRPKSFW